jgi:ribosomal protein S15P/S13E
MLDPQLVKRLLPIVHSADWDVIMSLFDVLDTETIKELKKFKGDALSAAQGKAEMIDRVKNLKAHLQQYNKDLDNNG